MSVGLDTPIGMPGQSAWTPSPSLKLDPLQVNAEWKNPLSAQPPQSSTNTFTPISTGLTPRYSPPAGGLISPGVSGEIAGAIDNPAQPSSSLADLFTSPEYPFSSVKTRSPNPTPPPPKRPPSQPSRPSLRPPQPPSASLQPLQPPPTSATQQQQQQHQQQQQPQSQQQRPQQHQQSQPQHHQQKTPQPISMAYPASYAPSGPPHPPTLVPVQQISHMSQPQQHAPITPQQPIPYTTAQQQQMSQPLQPVPPPPQSYGGYSVIPPSQHPQAPQPPPQPPRVEPMIAPLPPRTDAIPVSATESEKKDTASVMPTTGHRSVLGSGIVSSAVQEAQVRARMKAETFAKNRKRKRHDDVVEEDKTDKNEDDAKLSPDQLRKKRYKRRLALNRESAAVSRVRRREYVKLLEEHLVNAEKERVRLAGELNEMQRQHTKLRQHLQQLELQVQERGGPAPPTDPTRGETY